MHIVLYCLFLATCIKNAISILIDTLVGFDKSIAF